MSSDKEILLDFVRAAEQENILFKDGNHGNNAVFTLMSDPALLKAIAEKGISDFAIEIPRELQPVLTAFQEKIHAASENGALDKIRDTLRSEFIAEVNEKFTWSNSYSSTLDKANLGYAAERNRLLADFLEQSTQFGIKVHAVDAAAHMPDNFSTGFRVFNKIIEEVSAEILKENGWETLTAAEAKTKMAAFTAKNLDLFSDRIEAKIEALKKSDPAQNALIEAYKVGVSKRLENKDHEVAAYIKKVTGGRPVAIFYGTLHNTLGNVLERTLQILVADTFFANSFKDPELQKALQANSDAFAFIYDVEANEIVPGKFDPTGTRNIPEKMPFEPPAWQEPDGP